MGCFHNNNGVFAIFLILVLLLFTGDEPEC